MMNTTQIPTTPTPIRQPVKRQNGRTPEEIAVENAVQHHVASYQRLQSERDELLDRVNKMEQLLTINKIEMEGLRAEVAKEQSRTVAYQTERDDAVANLAVYQTLFTALTGLLRTFGIEHAPLVKDPPKAAP